MPKTQARTTREAQIDKKLAPATQDELKAQVEAFMSGRLDSVVRTKVNPLTGGINFSANNTTIPVGLIHPAYFCHLDGRNLTPDDGSFLDSSGAGNNATRGANLSIAQMATAAGYATTIAPVTGTLDSVLHIPALNFDWDAGEVLLIYWRGKMAAPAAHVNLMGDTESNFRNGLKIRVGTNGKLDTALYSSVGPISVFGPAGVGVIADGTIHDFAYLYDGANKKLYRWEDGVLVGIVNGFGAAGCDTTNMNDWMVGAAYKSPTNATGIAASTRNLVMMRWGASTLKPDPADVTTAIQRLRANPGRLLTVSDL